MFVRGHHTGQTYVNRLASLGGLQSAQKRMANVSVLFIVSAESLSRRNRASVLTSLDSVNAQKTPVYVT
jgi:hypothetical protein